jgi:chromosome partitioning protein
LIDNYQSLHRGDTIYTTIIDSQPLPLRSTKVPNLDIVPSHILLADTDMALTTAIDHRESRLKIQLDKIKHNYEYIFLDCPPSLGWQTINALTASDEAVVVVEPGYFELDSIVQLSKTIQKVQSLFNSNLRIRGFLFVKSEATIASRQSLQLLRQTYGELVFDTVIPRNTDMKDAHFQRQDIFEYRPLSTSAQAYSKLIKEVFDL